MSQGYIGYDLQNAIRSELLSHGIYKTVSTVLTQVMVDPYDEAFYKPSKVIGRVMNEEEAAEEEDAEDAEDAPCPQAARLKASTRLSESAVTRLNFMVLLLCCFGV